MALQLISKDRMSIIDIGITATAYTLINNDILLIDVLLTKELDFFLEKGMSYSRSFDSENILIKTYRIEHFLTTCRIHLTPAI